MTRHDPQWDKPWYETENEPRWMGGIGKWAVFGTLLVVGLIALVWALNVGTAEQRGKGDAFRQKQSGTNRVISQERFEDMYQDILAADRRIEVMADAAKADPQSNVAKVNLTGAINYCIQAVADYNAESRKYSAGAFRAADLPAKIDNDDSDTDCKEQP